MIYQSNEIKCVWKPGFLKSGHIYDPPFKFCFILWSGAVYDS